MRYKLTIEYFHKRLCGEKVKNIVEEAINFFFQENTKVFIASRTDLGVRVLNQIAHFDLSKDSKTVFSFLGYFNSFSKFIFIKNIEEVSENFNSRKDVILKEYMYKIFFNQSFGIDKNAVYVKQKLNLNNIFNSIKLLEGKKDFSSFISKNRLKINLLTISNLTIQLKNNEIKFYIRAKSFRYKQIRNIIGFLVHNFGLIKENLSNQVIQNKIHYFFNLKNRSLLKFKCFPAIGLTLKNILY